jgi:hypothetical protein
LLKQELDSKEDENARISETNEAMKIDMDDKERRIAEFKERK